MTAPFSTLSVARFLVSIWLAVTVSFEALRSSFEARKFASVANTQHTHTRRRSGVWNDGAHAVTYTFRIPDSASSTRSKDETKEALLRKQQSTSNETLRNNNNIVSVTQCVGVYVFMCLYVCL